MRLKSQKSNVTIIATVSQKTGNNEGKPKKKIVPRILRCLKQKQKIEKGHRHNAHKV